MLRPYGFVITLFLALPAYAGVSKISSPKVEKGVAEIEYSGTRYGDDRRSQNNKQSHTYEAEYGLTDRFMLGLEGKSERSANKGHQFEGYGLEAQYELTTQGTWWLDSAVKAEYLHVPNGADEAELKLLAARSYGKSSVTINFGLERETGTGREHGITYGSAVQAKHLYNEHFAPGVEWHGEYGEDDTHYLGPIVTGELFELGKGEVEYTAGYYWGLNHASADNAARIQLSYEFKL